MKRGIEQYINLKVRYPCPPQKQPCRHDPIALLRTLEGSITPHPQSAPTELGAPQNIGPVILEYSSNPQTKKPHNPPHSFN